MKKYISKYFDLTVGDNWNIEEKATSDEVDLTCDINGSSTVYFQLFKKHTPLEIESFNKDFIKKSTAKGLIKRLFNKNEMSLQSTESFENKIGNITFKGYINKFKFGTSKNNSHLYYTHLSNNNLLISFSYSELHLFREYFSILKNSNVLTIEGKEF